MTTIAYRGGVIAADSAIFDNDTRCGSFTKIAKGEDGRIGGAAGSAYFAHLWVHWIKRAGAVAELTDLFSHDKDHESEGVVIWPDGRIEVFNGRCLLPIACNYYASGSGADIALGAMHAGADAEAALKAACAHDCHTDGPIIALTLGKSAEIVEMKAAEAKP